MVVAYLRLTHSSGRSLMPGTRVCTVCQQASTTLAGTAATVQFEPAELSGSAAAEHDDCRPGGKQRGDFVARRCRPSLSPDVGVGQAHWAV
jgi:hypothetical protein